MADLTFYVYMLYDPREEMVCRYIGQTINPEVRLQNHLRDGTEIHKVHWIRSLRKDGITPRIKVLCQFENEVEALISEKILIDLLRDAGHPLTNIALGGSKSPMLGRQHTLESKDKMREAKLGVCQTDEHISARMVSIQNYWSTESESREQQLKRLREQPLHLNCLHSEETKEILRQKGLEQRNNLSDEDKINHAKATSEGTKRSYQKRREEGTLKPLPKVSEATRVKLRAAQQRRRANETLEQRADLSRKVTLSLYKWWDKRQELGV